MPQATIDQLIVNSPYEEPTRHWRYDRSTRLFDLADGRRPAGYVVASEDSRAFDDPGEFVEIPLVNAIRPRVKAWRERGYPGASGITRRLLHHWREREAEDRRLFFCQLEAAETLIWLAEAPSAERVGIEVPSDGGEFARLCAKMATGAGKTIVMAMVIAWQVLNRVAAGQDRRFAKNVLVIAPGLTVKSRLQVLEPAHPGNYYEAFGIVPAALLDRLRQGRVLVRNWHALNWETDERLARRRSVDKRGAKSDEAYVRDVLGEMAGARDVLVLNDEAHHAWRITGEASTQGMAKQDVEEATKWIGGLDRIHRARGILRCYDFSATPFTPAASSGRMRSEDALFGWIVSDFGLNDAIEAGLVKTPRVVVRDDAVPDAKTYKSRLYHIYNDAEVKDDLTRQAKPNEPLPDLVRNGYYLLGYDWRETAKAWQAAGLKVRPTMITVANRTETAARVKHAFDNHDILIDELCDPERTLHIDSKVLTEAESATEVGGEGAMQPRNATERAELLRRQVDTVGQPGTPGEAIQNVISVGMLSEGWDVKTVTHIMGLRAFTSQLLCEQVVGRGLRRTAYEVSAETGLFEPEYVNVFGVPFTFLPHEAPDEDVLPKPAKPTTLIEPAKARGAFEISWPNVVRIDRTFAPQLLLRAEALAPLVLNAAGTPKLAELAPVVEGQPDVAKIEAIDLKALAEEYRMQRIVFETAARVFDDLREGCDWAQRARREVLLSQVVHLTERFLRSNKVIIEPRLFNEDELGRRLLLTLNMTRIVQHLWQALQFENVERLAPVFDRDHAIRSTGDMAPWHTTKPTAATERSHINRCVFDSTWEATEAFALDRSELVDAWAKNDHLGFEVLYVHAGVVRKYRPDFLIRLQTGAMLVLEVKGREREQDRVKRRYMEQWCTAVNQHGGFGRWACAVSWQPGDVQDILKAKSQSASDGTDAPAERC